MKIFGYDSDLLNAMHRVAAYNGFMQRPSVPEIQSLAARFGLPFNPAETTCFLGRVTVFITGTSRMKRWRKALFASPSFFLLRKYTPFYLVREKQQEAAGSGMGI